MLKCTYSKINSATKPALSSIAPRCPKALTRNLKPSTLSKNNPEMYVVDCDNLDPEGGWKKGKRGKGGTEYRSKSQRAKVARGRARMNPETRVVDPTPSTLTH